MVKNSPMRMILAAQESMFSQQRLAVPAARWMRRTVGFYHLSIDHEDVLEVIEGSCLIKNQEQAGMVQRHLYNFLDCYPRMQKYCERYVGLFPLHPDIVRQISNLCAVRRSGVLEALSNVVMQCLNWEWDRTLPSIVAADHYWEILQEDLAEESGGKGHYVLAAAEELEERIKELFVPAEQPLARRVVHALCLKRVASPGGNGNATLSAQELRYDICLYLPGHGNDSRNLSKAIEQILKTLSGCSSKWRVESDDSTERYFLSAGKKSSYNKKITLEEISQRIGVSRTTIYKIINNKGYVSDETRAVVEKALKQYNYVPNYNARDLAHHKNYKIAYIGMAHHGSRYFAKMTQMGIQKALAELADNGLEVVSSIAPVTQPRQQIEDIEQMLREGIRDFVIVPCSPEVLEEEIRKLRGLHCNIIYLSRYVKEPRNRIFVGIDYPKSGMLAAEMMSKIMPGGGTIAVTICDKLEDDLWVKQRYDGFVEYLAGQKKFEIVCLKDGITTDASAEAMCEELFEEFPHLNAIYDISYKVDVIARKLVQLKRGHDIKLIGFDLYDAILPYLKSGVVDVIIGQSLSNQAYDAMKMMFYHICYGTPIREGDYNSRLDVIVSSNADCFDY